MYDVMISVATFDIVPTDDLFPAVFPSLPEDDEAFNDKFDRMDIGSRFMVMNMGTMLIVLSFYGFLFIIYPCCRYVKKDAKCARKYEPQIRKMLFWTHIILFLQEGYLDLLLAGAINIFFIRSGLLTWETTSLVVTNALSIIMVAGCGILLLFTACYLWPNFTKLKTKSFKKKYLPVYEMLNLRHGKWTMLWPVSFMIRRSLFVIGVCLV